MLGLLGLGLYPIHADPRLLFVVSAWLGFFGFGWYGPWVAWVSELSPQNQVGATLGLAMALNQVAIVITPMVFGVLTDAIAGYRFPGILLIAWLAIQSAYVCFVRTRAK